MKKISTFIFIYFFCFHNVYADNYLLKPNKNYKPANVVEIQLNALKNNNIPFINAGIKQTWEFAHPLNKQSTGPLPKFIKLLNNKGYKNLLNHIEHNIVEIYKSEKKFVYEVIILDKEKKYYKYQWIVEKFLNEGNLYNCWLTTSVSSASPLGDSV